MTQKQSFLILVLCLVFGPLSCLAQKTGDGYWPKKYISIGFVNSTLSQEGIPSLKSNYGASFSVGRSFYLHKPICKILRFGIDATWLDLNYTNYKIQHITYWGENVYDIHEAEVGMQVGPSIALNPLSKILIHVYCRYAPTYMCFYSDDRFQGQYASYIVGGAALSYRAIGLGMEWRHGTSDASQLLNIYNVESNDNKITTKTNGFRAFITFRF